MLSIPFQTPPPVCKLVTTKFSWRWETRSSISVLTKVFQLTNTLSESSGQVEIQMALKSRNLLHAKLIVGS